MSPLLGHADQKVVAWWLPGSVSCSVQICNLGCTMLCRSLHSNMLSGTLPSQLVEQHKYLSLINVSHCLPMCLLHNTVELGDNCPHLHAACSLVLIASLEPFLIVGLPQWRVQTATACDASCSYPGPYTSL